MASVRGLLNIQSLNELTYENLHAGERSTAAERRPGARRNASCRFVKVHTHRTPNKPHTRPDLKLQCSQVVTSSTLAERGLDRSLIAHHRARRSQARSHCSSPTRSNTAPV